MEYKQIQELIKTINKSNISELSIEEGDFKIVIKQEMTAPAQYVAMPQMPMQAPVPQPMPQAAASPAGTPPAAEKPAAPAAASNLITIKSPMIGTFYRSPAPDK